MLIHMYRAKMTFPCTTLPQCTMHLLHNFLCPKTYHLDFRQPATILLVANPKAYLLHRLHNSISSNIISNNNNHSSISSSNNTTRSAMVFRSHSQVRRMPKKVSSWSTHLITETKNIKYSVFFIYVWYVFITPDY